MMDAVDHMIPNASRPGDQSDSSLMSSWDPVLGTNTIDGIASLQVPSFFEQIMVPNYDFVGADAAQFPPDIASLLPDQDWLGEIDIFGSDFAPTVDGALGILPGMSTDEQTQTVMPEVERSDPQTLSQTEHARKRHAIFQRSPWLWVPESNQNAFSEHNNIQLDEGNLHSAASPHQPFAETLSIPDRLSMQSRDRILQLIIKTATSQLSIPAFPSADCLDLLMKMGIAKRLETDAWIHPYAFRSADARPELLTALVAAGCVCFGVKSVSRTGLVLLEIVRVALSRMIEDDNSALRNLQYLQASMIWLDVCAFCGFKRKMEIAESNLQPLVTALRRYGKFDRVAYAGIEPLATDSNDVLEEKWRQWIEAQSYSRLVHHLFEHDMMMTMTKHRNPLLSYAELSLPLPASRELWLASSAEVWRTAYLTKPGHSHQHRLALRALLAESELIRCLPDSVDAQLATAAYLHGNGAQVWEYNQQALLQGSNGGAIDASASLWIQSRHQKLVQTLEAASSSIPESLTSARLLHEFLLTSLHVSLDDVMRFAGKCGEEEAHRAYQVLQLWSQSKQARIAIWHAAQVVRAARAALPYQLRGSDAFLTYHAVMILWAYGMMQRDAARRTARSSPAPGANGHTDSIANNTRQVVFLDRPKSTDIDAFLYRNQGRPCLQLQTTRAQAGDGQAPSVCDLRNPQSAMLVGIQVLECNCPNEQRSGMPQMIRSLCDLMSELGSLR